MVFQRPDFVKPQSVAKTAAAVAERLRSVTWSTFDPAAAGAFVHATTAVSTLIPALLLLGATSISSAVEGSFNLAITTTSPSSDMFAAVIALANRANTLELLLNRVVYTLEANGMTT